MFRAIIFVEFYGFVKKTGRPNSRSSKTMLHIPQSSHKPLIVTKGISNRQSLSKRALSQDV